jgi:hypothetical protein
MGKVVVYYKDKCREFATTPQTKMLDLYNSVQDEWGTENSYCYRLMDGKWEQSNFYNVEPGEYVWIPVTQVDEWNKSSGPSGRGWGSPGTLPVELLPIALTPPSEEEVVDAVEALRKLQASLESKDDSEASL